jgi:hypothetical protein
MYLLKMCNLSLYFLFAVFVGISESSGNELHRKHIDRNVIGAMNEVIGKPYRLNRATDHQKFKGAGMWYRIFSQAYLIGSSATRYMVQSGILLQSQIC